MARIRFVAPGDPQVSAALIEDTLTHRGGVLPGIDGLLLHSEPVTRAWHGMFGTLARQCVLDFKIREIAILRICHLTRARYPGFQHRHIALGGGIPREVVDAIAVWQESDAFDERERAVLAYVDAMTVAVQVPDAVFADLQAHFNERQIVELTVTVAGYNMVARFTEALDLEPPATGEGVA